VIDEETRAALAEEDDVAAWEIDASAEETLDDDERAVLAHALDAAAAATRPEDGCRCQLCAGGEL